MKHLKNFENYSEEVIRDMLVRSQKKNDIEIKTSIDNVINNIIDPHDVKSIGTFKGFIISEGDFISEGDKGRMQEYIQEFKKLGLNISKAEKLLSSYQRYWEIENQMDYVGYPGKGDEEEYVKFVTEQNDLEDDVEAFETEIKKLAKEAKDLL